MISDLKKTYQLFQYTDTRTNGAANVSAVATPKRRDMAGTQEVDPDAEYIVVGVEIAATAAATLQLLDASGGTAKGTKFMQPASGMTGLLDTWIPMGPGKAIYWTSTITGDLSFTLHYIRKNRSLAKQA